MPNYRRATVEGGTYFFTLVTYNRRPFLTTPTARCALRESFQEIRARRPFKIDAIVLLPDHLHCIWTLPGGDHGYSQRWSRIKAGFTTRYLENGGSDCDVSISRAVRGERGIWQRRFFEHLIRDDDDLKRCVDYIHINPVKHVLVKRVCEWPWSSFHRYVKLGEYPLDWGGSNEFYGDEWLRFG